MRRVCTVFVRVRAHRQEIAENALGTHLALPADMLDANLAASAQDLVCVTDAETRFLRMNAAFAYVLGYDPSFLEERSLLDLVHDGDRGTTAIELLSALTRKAKSVAFKNRLRCSDGSYRWFEWRGTLEADGLFYAVARATR